MHTYAGLLGLDILLMQKLTVSVLLDTINKHGGVLFCACAIVNDLF